LNTPSIHPLGRRLRSHGLVRELLSAAACLIIGILVMPCVIYALGRASLGPYEHGGAFGLWRDFLAGLGSGSEAFWFVALGPYLLYWLVRAGRRLLHN
jgi:hypothetical protein